TDPNYRARIRAAAKDWAVANPDKRDAQRLRKFGLTPVERDRLLAEQGGGCAVCGERMSRDKDPRTGKQRRLHVDHCHRTGRVRGLLCASCNLGLGKFQDDPSRLERAAEYLRRTMRTVDRLVRTER